MSPQPWCNIYNGGWACSCGYYGEHWSGRVNSNAWDTWITGYHLEAISNEYRARSNQPPDAKQAKEEQ